MTSRIMLRRLTEVVQELYKAFKSYQARRHPEGVSLLRERCGQTSVV